MIIKRDYRRNQLAVDRSLIDRRIVRLSICLCSCHRSEADSDESKIFEQSFRGPHEHLIGCQDESVRDDALCRIQFSVLLEQHTCWFLVSFLQ